MLWISIILIALPIVLRIGECFAGARLAKKGLGYSCVPFVFGIMLFAGVILLPIDLPVNRFLAAFLAMCLDHTISLGIPMLLYMWYRGDFKEDDSDSAL